MKQIVGIYYKDLCSTMESCYQKNYPDILTQLQYLMSRFQILVQGIQVEFASIFQTEKELNKEARSILKKCWHHFTQMSAKSTSHLSLEKINRFLEIKTNIEYFQIHFHTLHHVEHKKTNYSKNLSNILEMIKELEKIPSLVKVEMDKHLIILTYIQQRLNEAQQYVKKYSKEHSIIEKVENNEAYYHSFIKLVKKTDANGSSVERESHKQLINQLRQRT